ncbi:uncharacterized membrane protein YidH (DUF202 family) [Flavobacterium nitrogenifigens]|uniref:Uncharacterized membrane protein YidH (DUF202 family) n=2 Tax=Flavobacterium TaxID=237 RepID=A0A7W7IWP0_9FLAO|nr:uncharacterized membrane protein YidH (DUF202 family) [Flavobacterium nitrogenifigens]MBB6386927.1 uncharacterized membrane protein YidH (DUF202 family) [Flavobacterium notoginsengisoli]
MNKLFFSIAIVRTSQNEIDGFILECIFALILITVFILCLYNRKKVYTYIIQRDTYNNLANIRLYLGLLLLITVSIVFIYQFFSKIFSKIF